MVLYGVQYLISLLFIIYITIKSHLCFFIEIMINIDIMNWTILLPHHNDDVSTGSKFNINDGAIAVINKNKPIRRVVLLNKINGPNKNSIWENIDGVT